MQEGGSPSQTAGLSQVGRIPALDGLRGAAILAVLLRHLFEEISPITATAPGFSSASHLDTVIFNITQIGWMGVDLFFVLSGYLITSILLQARRSPHYFRNFYMRRILRIFPLYYLILSIAFVLPYHLQLGVVRQTIGDTGHAIWYWCYLSNFYLAADHGRQSMLMPTWSLAIEEQFYLIWPAVVLLCTRRRLLRLCVAIILAAAGARLAMYAMGFSSWAIYVFSPCRADALAIGAFMAVLSQSPVEPHHLRGYARNAIGLALILFSISLAARWTSGWVPGLGSAYKYTIIALFCAGLVVYVAIAPPGSILHRLFAATWLRLFGRLSYAMYLFHMPIIRILRDHVYDPRSAQPFRGSLFPPQFAFVLLSLGAVTTAAWLSWRLYEKPFLSLKHFFEYDPSSKHANTDVAIASAPQ